MDRRRFIGAAGAAAALNGMTYRLRAEETLPVWVKKLLTAAESQVGVTTHYDPVYQRIAYPNGDVPRDRGVCTDVIVRAYRDALDLDLQKLVHIDMEAHFADYPHRWGLKAPDSNIDHRRVGNLQCFFRRHGRELPISKTITDYAPGDIYTCLLPGNLAHIGFVSAQKADDSGNWLIIHNIGEGAKIEDRLFEFPFTGHYRFPPPGV